MHFNSRSNRPPDPSVVFKGASLVQPQFARDTDINVMIQRYMHGDASVLARHGSQVMDATSLPDSLHDALNVKAKADYLWHTLPPQVQASYGNYNRFVEALEHHAPPPKSDKVDTSSEKIEKPTDPVTPSTEGAK